MLLRSPHQHIAFFKLNPEREHRLAWFAKDKKEGEENGPEEEALTPPNQPGESPEITQNIAGIAKEVRGDILNIGPLLTAELVSNTLQSPVMLGLVMSHSSALGSGQETLMIARRLRFLKADATERTALEEELGQTFEENEASCEQALSQAMSNIEVLFAIAESFEQRIDSYEENDYSLGSLSEEQLGRIEAELMKRWQPTDDAEREFDLREALELLKPDEMRELVQLVEARDPQRQPRYDNGKRADPPKRKSDKLPFATGLIDIAKNAVKRWFRRKHKTVNDTHYTGDEDTLSSIDRLRGNHDALRKSFDNHLRMRANELLNKFTVGIRNVLEQVSGNNDEVSFAAVKFEIIKTLVPILRAARIPTSEAISRLKGLMPDQSERLDEVEQTIKQHENDPEYPKEIAVDDPDFIPYAQATLEQLSELQYINETQNAGEFKDKFLGQAKLDHEESVEWAKRMGGQLNKARECLQSAPKDEQERLLRFCNIDPADAEGTIDYIGKHSSFLSRFADNTASDEDYDTLWNQYLPHERRELEQLTAVLSNSTQLSIAQKVQNRLQENADVSIDDVDEIQGRLAHTYRQLFEDFTLPQELQDSTSGKQLLLDHDALKPLNLKTQVYEFSRRAQMDLSSAKRIEGTAERALQSRQQYLQQAVTSVQYLEDLCKKIEPFSTANLSEMRDRSVRVVSREEWKYDPEETPAYFKKGDGFIYVVEGLEGKIQTEMIDHELGHGLIHAINSNGAIAPDLFMELAGELENGRVSVDDGQGGSQDMSFMELLRQQDYQIDEKSAQGSQEEQNQAYMDELVNRYASWVHLGRPGLATGASPQKQQERQLFQLLDNISKKNEAVAPDFDWPEGGFDKNKLAAIVPEDDDGEAYSSGSLTDGADDGGDDDGGSGGSEADSTPDPKAIMDAIRTDLATVNNFLHDHPHLPQHGDIQDWYDEVESTLEKIQERFVAGQPANQIAEMAQKLAGEIEDDVDAIKKYKQAELDLTGEAATGRTGWRALFGDMSFVSVYDIIGAIQSGAEDIQRMWKRRGEKKQSMFGQAMTGWISDRVPYAGQLKHEFNRRGNQSELDEVKQWKDAFENTDSYALIEMLGNTRNKDQLRAIVELLKDRGRMDWNSVPFWKNLNSLSNYNMPIDACINNDLLRDKWLEKLFTDIWSDKEHFKNWRRENDSNYQSEMDKYTDLVDQLANIDGGLDGELKRILEVWERSKKSGEIPNSVDPHRYEKILKYAIENGKMSMEQKFFYLVQGIATGLMSIDRIRVLAGEKGGVLNQFPLLDYFYQKNNTLPEIQSLAFRIRETGSDAFKPGMKTRIWLQLEAARNESARQRVIKAMSGGRLENIDHEDFPAFMAFANYETINTITDVISGGRLQMSPEARKNTYVGFANKFQAMARLAELEEKGHGRFSDQDVKSLAQSITAAIHMDNTLTQNAVSGKRALLTWNQIKNEGGPSTGGRKVQEVRVGNMDFMNKLVDTLGTDLDWSAVGVNREEFLREGGDDRFPDETKAGKHFKAVAAFERELEKAMLKNTDLVKEILRDFGDDFIGEHAQTMEYKDTEDFITSRRDASLAVRELQAKPRPPGAVGTNFDLAAGFK